MLQQEQAQRHTCLSSPKTSHTLSRYREYLKSYYHNDPIVRDDKLLIAPCSQFINLSLVKSGTSVNQHDSLSKFIGTRRSKTLFQPNFRLFDSSKDESKTLLSMDSIVTPDSRFVLVEGALGTGKSTLCWELCRKWDTLKSLQDFKIVLQLKLRERRVQNAASLNELFYHEDRRLSQSVVDEVLQCEGEGILLILDGFDEVPPTVIRDPNCLMMRLISGQCLHV